MQKVILLQVGSPEFNEIIQAVTIQGIEIGREIERQSRVRWINKEKAKEILHIKGDVKLQRLRNEDEITFTDDDPMLYLESSIYAYLERKSKRKR